MCTSLPCAKDVCVVVGGSGGNFQWRELHHPLLDGSPGLEALQKNGFTLSTGVLSMGGVLLASEKGRNVGDGVSAWAWGTGCSPEPLKGNSAAGTKEKAGAICPKVFPGNFSGKGVVGAR